MKVIDILADSANLLGLDEEVEVLKNATEDMEPGILCDYEKIKKLFNLCKYSTRELCTNYMPIVANVKLGSKDNQIAISNLENFIRIQSVNKNGEMIRFKVINRNIVLSEDDEYEILYESYPEITSLFQEIDFLENFSPDVIVLGLCAYYSVAYGMFEEFQDFYEKYQSKAESLKQLKNFTLPTRRWE